MKNTLMQVRNNILIAEIGSTSGLWAFISEQGQEVQIIETEGYNPHTHSEYILERILIKLKGDIGTPQEVIYYGAGVVSSDVADMIEAKLSTQFDGIRIEVHSDTLAAARASCGNLPGIVCILGTGSNSSSYDGVRLVDGIPSLGFPLGDEGSGWHIGLAVIRGFYYRTIAHDLVEEVRGLLPDTKAEFLEYVKHSPTPNTYLGSFAKFAGEKKSHPWIRKTVRICLDAFVETHVLPLQPSAEVHFIGSIAWSFSDILEESLASHQLHMGRVLKDPMESLIKYHLSL